MNAAKNSDPGKTPSGREAPEREASSVSRDDGIFRLLFEQTADALLLLDVSSNEFVDCNEAASRMLGYRTKSGLLPLHPALLSPARQPDGRASREKADEMIATALQRGSHRFEWTHCSPHRADFPVEVLLTPVQLEARRLILTTWRDLSERSAMERVLRRTNRTLQLISACNGILVRATHEQGLLDALCRLLVERGGYRFAWVGFAETDPAKTVRPAAQSGAEGGYLETTGITWADTERGRGPVGCAIRSGQLCIVRDTATDPAFAPWRAEARKRGFASVIALPLISRGRTLGALVLYGAESAAADESETTLLMELAGDLAFGLASLRDQAEHTRAKEQLLLLNAALVAAPNSIVITDARGVIEWVNPAFTAHTGYSFAEAVGQNPRLLKSGHQPDAYYAGMWRTILAGRNWHGEFINKRRNGELYHEDVTIAPIRDAAGTIRHFVAIKFDVTARKQAEEAQRRLAAIIESTTDCVGQADADGRLLYLNAAGLRLLGYDSLEKITGRPIADFHSPASAALVLQEGLPAALRDGTWTGETELCARDGRLIPVSQVIIVGRAPDGTVTHTSAIMRDLTERHQAVKALTDSQQNLDTLIQSVEGIVWEADAQTFAFTYVSQRAERLLGYPCERWLKEPSFWREHIHPDDRERAVQFCANATAAMKDHEFEYRMLAADGRAVWLRDIVTVVVENDRPAKLRGIMVDLTERKQAEARLLEQAAIIDHSPIAIVITDLAHRVTYCNQGAVQLYGLSREELMHQTADELFTAETMARLGTGRAAALAHGRWSGEVPIVTRAGRRIQAEFLMALILDDAGQPKARLSIATDISEKKKLQEQFFRAQRLESLGMLAAGIAHDLNNVLTPILMAGPMLRVRATDPMDLRLLETLERSAERGAGLVRQILSFAHGSAGEARVLQVKHLVRDIAALIEETFPKSIQLEQDVPADLWPVAANPTQIHQILLNLCVNARDAMPNGGTLRLLAANRRLDAVAAAAIPGGRPGPFVVVEVRDNGTGIPPEVFARIWEPFFTTKGEGKGTGLGLSTVRGIVENHRGFISLQTTLGAGTAFRVYLPAAEIDDEPSLSTHPFLSRGNGELLLLVDDEAANRDVAQATLARYGYRVLVAASGAEAVSMFIPRAGEIRLLITDVHMPTIDGAALSHILQRFKPGLGILAMSGLSGTSGATTERPEQFASDFLAKPFKPEALLVKVHALLQRSSPPPAGP